MGGYNSSHSNSRQWRESASARSTIRKSPSATAWSRRADKRRRLSRAKAFWSLRRLANEALVFIMIWFVTIRRLSGECGQSDRGQERHGANPGSGFAQSRRRPQICPAFARQTQEWHEPKHRKPKRNAPTVRPKATSRRARGPSAPDQAHKKSPRLPRG